MNKQFETIKKSRESVLKLIEGLSLEQLNTIPHGFSNNIIWNLGHLVAAQQGVCYKRPGLDMIISDDFFDTYKPGTKPEKPVEAEDLENIKALMYSTIDRLETDYTKGLMAVYPAWTTRYGVELATIEDAINFLPFHEGMHIGYIMALKRVVS